MRVQPRNRTHTDTHCARPRALIVRALLLAIGFISLEQRLEVARALLACVLMEILELHASGAAAEPVHLWLRRGILCPVEMLSHGAVLGLGHVARLINGSLAALSERARYLFLVLQLRLRSHV